MFITRLIIAAALMAPQFAQAAPTCDGQFVDAARGDRVVPVRLRLPDGSARVPVILFSHGLGGSLAAGARWAEAWTAAGFAVLNVQHPGSDASLLGVATGPAALAALRKGATPEQLLARVTDMRFVINRLGRGATIGACPLARLDLTRIGVAGHSMGAQTVQAVAGQTFALPGGRRGFGDSRVKAAIAFSPAPPARDDTAKAFAGVHIPFFSITGTDDAVPLLTSVTPADRQRPFAAMPAGDKYLLVLAGADHMVFSGGEGQRAATRNDARVAALVIEATSRFWLRYLLGQNEIVTAIIVDSDDRLLEK